jgi:hypothetical protein
MTAKIFGDEGLMRRIVELATQDVTGKSSIPSSCNLEEIISKTYAVLSSRDDLLATVMHNMMSESHTKTPQRHARQDPAEQDTDEIVNILSLQNLEQKYSMLFHPVRFKSKPVEQDGSSVAPAVETGKMEPWNTSGNAFALVCELERSLLKTICGLLLFAAMENQRAEAVLPLMLAVSASSLVGVVARHFVTAESPECRSMYSSGPANKPALVAPIVKWIRTLREAGHKSEIDGLYDECISALKTYSTARSTALQTTETEAAIVHGVVVWQDPHGKLEHCEWETIESARDSFSTKSEQGCAARLYSLTRKEKGNTLAMLAQANEHDTEGRIDMDMDNHVQLYFVTCELAEWDHASNPGRSFFTLGGGGSTITYERHAPDFCNVVSAKPLTEGKHAFEFVIHKLGDEMWSGVTCKEDVAGVTDTLRGAKNSWTYYCGRRHHTTGALHLDGDSNQQVEHIKSGDIIGIFVNFEDRILLFEKNGVPQGTCSFPAAVKELYLVTELDYPFDEVEIRAKNADPLKASSVKKSYQWGDTDTLKAPAWLKGSIKKPTVKPSGEQKPGIGVALVLVESMLRTKCLTGNQITHLFETLTLGLFLSADPAQIVSSKDDLKKSRLKVGMTVRLTENYHQVQGNQVRDGPLRPGLTGVLLVDDRSSNPYQVHTSDGREHWYEEGTIEEATPLKCKDETLFEISQKLLGCIKLVMTSDYEAFEPGPHFCKLISLLRSNQLSGISKHDNCNTDLEILLAFDRQRNPQGSMEQLLQPWIVAEKQQTPMCSPQGSQQNLGPLWCAIATTQWGKIPAKTDGTTCWFPYGDREHEASDFEIFEGQLFSNSSDDIEPQGNQDDGAGVLWCAVALTPYGKIPGKAKGNTCWYSYDGVEKCCSDFLFVGVDPSAASQAAAPEVLKEQEFVNMLEGEYAGESWRVSISRKSGQRNLVFIWKQTRTDEQQDVAQVLEWELIPEKVSDDPETYATLGLNVGTNCPFYDDGHVFLMLEFTGLNISTIHGAEGIIFKPETPKTTASPAISKISSVLKSVICLDQLEARRPFQSWLTMTDPPLAANPACSTLIPEDWEKAVDNSIWSLEADEVLSRCVVNTVVRKDKSNECEVGSRVRLAESPLRRSLDADSRLLTPNVVGIVTRVYHDEGRLLYEVEYNGDICRYEQDEVELVHDNDEDAPGAPGIPEAGEGIFAHVSPNVLKARLQVLTQVSKVLCKGVQHLNLKEYSRKGSVAHSLHASTCVRVLIRPAINTVFASGVKKLQAASTGVFPSFVVNRGILPAETRKRRDTVFNQTFEKVGSMPDKYSLLETKSRGVGLMFWEVQFEGEGGMDYGGLFRDSLREICAELQSDGTLQLLVASPNNKYMVAGHQGIYPSIYTSVYYTVNI